MSKLEDIYHALMRIQDEAGIMDEGVDDPAILAKRLSEIYRIATGQLEVIQPELDPDHAPVRGEIREFGNSRYYVQGPYKPDLDDRQPVVPVTDLLEVEGRWIGSKFGVETEKVKKWKVVSRPDE